MSRTLYFAIGRCQHGKGGCQAAAGFTQQATIISPDFDDEQSVHAWLRVRAEDPSRRRCRGCKRPIGMQHFAIRSFTEHETI